MEEFETVVLENYGFDKAALLKISAFFSFLGISTKWCLLKNQGFQELSIVKKLSTDTFMEGLVCIISEKYEFEYQYTSKH